MTAVAFRLRPWLKRRPKLRRFLQETAIFSCVNFIAFLIVLRLIGGDAFSVHAENGLYYLQINGQMSQVSSEVFFYFKTHAISVFITFPAMLAICVLLFEPLRRQPGSSS